MFDNIAKVFDNAKSQVLACLSSYTLILTTDLEVLQAPKRAARARGVKLRYITDITTDNLSYCKRQMSMVDELRHLEGIRGNFIISDNEFMVSPDISKENPLTDGVYSNVDKILKQQWYVFETIWNYAVSADIRIGELEKRDGIIASKRNKSKRTKVIDRIYACTECKSKFIYGEEAEEHKTSIGHKNIREFQLENNGAEFF